MSMAINKYQAWSELSGLEIKFLARDQAEAIKDKTQKLVINNTALRINYQIVNKYLCCCFFPTTEHQITIIDPGNAVELGCGRARSKTEALCCAITDFVLSAKVQGSLAHRIEKDSFSMGEQGRNNMIEYHLNLSNSNSNSLRGKFEQELKNKS